MASEDESDGLSWEEVERREAKRRKVQEDKVEDVLAIRREQERFLAFRIDIFALQKFCTRFKVDYGSAMQYLIDHRLQLGATYVAAQTPEERNCWVLWDSDCQPPYPCPHCDAFMVEEYSSICETCHHPFCDCCKACPLKGTPSEEERRKFRIKMKARVGTDRNLTTSR